MCAGGLEESVSEAVLHAAFLPFGDIKDVSLPLDHGTQKNRGFGFVTYIERRAAALPCSGFRGSCSGELLASSAHAHFAARSDDAQAAMDNMQCVTSSRLQRFTDFLLCSNAELYGRVLRVNLAQPDKTGGSGTAIWKTVR